MPKYFFDMADGMQFGDPEGDELRDDEEAQYGGIGLLLEVMRDEYRRTAGRPERLICRIRREGEKPFLDVVLTLETKKLS